MTQRLPIIPATSTYLMDLSSQRQIAVAMKDDRILTIKVYEADGRAGRFMPNETIFALQDFGAELQKGYPSYMPTSEKEHLDYRDDGVTYRTQMFKFKVDRNGEVINKVTILPLEYTCDGSISRTLGVDNDNAHRLRFIIPQKYMYALDHHKFRDAPISFDMVCNNFSKGKYGNAYVNSDALLQMQIIPHPHKRSVAHIARAHVALRQSAKDALSLRDPLWLHHSDFVTEHKALRRVMTS